MEIMVQYVMTLFLSHLKYKRVFHVLIQLIFGSEDKSYFA